MQAQAAARDSSPSYAGGAPVLRSLPALEARRSRARVTTDGGRRLVGWVTAFDDTLLVVNPDERPFDLLPRRAVTYDRRSIRSLELSERPRWRAEATALGLLGGGLLGGLVGASSSGDCPENAWGPCGGEFGFAAGALIGSSIGAILGRHVIGRDQWREIDPRGRAANGGERNRAPGGS